MSRFLHITKYGHETTLSQINGFQNEFMIVGLDSFLIIDLIK